MRQRYCWLGGRFGRKVQQQEFDANTLTHVPVDAATHSVVGPVTGRHLVLADTVAHHVSRAGEGIQIFDVSLPFVRSAVGKRERVVRHVCVCTHARTHARMYVVCVYVRGLMTGRIKLQQHESSTGWHEGLAAYRHTLLANEWERFGARPVLDFFTNVFVAVFVHLAESAGNERDR